MKKEFARRLPGVGKWVRALEELEVKYARLKAQRDELKIDLAETHAQLNPYLRERNEREAELHKLECALPIPPENLRLRVHGNGDEASFLSVGRQMAAEIKHVIAEEGFALESFERVLDFGCGCGRVLRCLGPHSGFFATDIDPEAIAWGQASLPNLATFAVNGDRPPLSYESDTFDFIYAISVFTHLPEDLEQLWLEELRRVARPGGTLLLTVHGERLFRRVPWAARPELQERGFCHSNCGLTEGLPDYYQTSFHREDYIRREWSKFFQIRRIAPLGGQDAVICQK
ncbi:MAG: class I SAM-dependent methyltransferase [Chthoniobacterales bacterium]